MNKRIDSLINKLIDWIKGLVPDQRFDESQPISVLEDIDLPDVLTRQDLLNSLVWHFKRRLKIETTERGLLFDTSFSVYMNEADYNDQEQSFGFTVKELVNTFHEIIAQMREKYPNYRSHARYWEFQFIPFRAGNIVKGMRQEVLDIPRKKIYVISFLLPTRGADASAASSCQRANVTEHTKDSFTMSNLSFNSDALKEVTILARDRFQVYFNNFLPLENDAMNDEQREIAVMDARATIVANGAKFILPDGSSNAIYMNTDFLQISGRGGMADKTGGITIVRLDSDKVMDNQLRLRYNPNTHQLYMISQGNVKLGERTIKSNNEIEIYEKSQILINGDITLTIKKIKKN